MRHGLLWTVSRLVGGDEVIKFSWRKWQGQVQNDKGNDEYEMGWFLHCAVHDGTVSGSGRNDGFVIGSKTTTTADFLGAE
ncbi:hypothetical protein [Tunturiibacter psychrotolerans]|uniref:hypothetical protein n=1 Tax=Tunturiibacter psychrotolerans TaxID=3069686 RepID=UPI003D2003D7